ncbi:hypothetical protein [Pseudomonas sp. RA_35y_Pfl2_P32]|uniref:hypothetical protein n=1 Tax=Pseudomonas sp. RA_35y_Pfl2_P32 TaxID=3088705 RepID=UPI0030D97527
MNIYQDEWRYWDDISARYVLKHASTDTNTAHVVHAAAHYADCMVVERRKRKRLTLPAVDKPPIGEGEGNASVAGTSVAI